MASIACIGDSMTSNISYNHVQTAYYPALLEGLLGTYLESINARSKPRVRASGVSGQTSTQIAARKVCLTTFGVPEIGIIFCGVNDPGGGISGATTKANLKTLAEQVLTANAMARVIVCTIHYQNFASGGHNTGSPLVANATPQDAPSLALWTAASEAVTEEAVTYPDRIVLCDFYQYGYFNLVTGPNTFHGHSVGGTPANVGVDTVWHEAVGDVHYNAVGQLMLANALYYTILNQTGWLAALSA